MSEYNSQERKILLELARNTIEGYAQTNKLPTYELKAFIDHLYQPRACFVTLQLQNRLRGCIGSLKAYQPLVEDVVQNAYNAAFQDPRFTPVTSEESTQLAIEISILSPPQPLAFSSEQELIAKLKPGIDGLIIYDQGHRATFLPSVWEDLTDPKIFLQHLKVKAGFAVNYWSSDIKAEFYTTEAFSS